MANTFLETIYNRKSVRHFTDQKVGEADLLTLVRAAMAAPSAVNKQPWCFIVLNERAKLDALGNALPYAKMLLHASAAIVVCGDLKLALTGTDKDYWVQDCSAATENILLAAEAMGLGGTWTAAFPYPERIAPVRAQLELPDHIIPLNVIPIGYPTGTDKAKDKWNADKVFFNSYNNQNRK